MSTYMDKSDADTCTDGHKYTHVGLQLGQFVANFREEE